MASAAEVLWTPRQTERVWICPAASPATPVTIITVSIATKTLRSGGSTRVMRDSLEVDKNDNLVPPNDARHVVLDLIAVTPTEDFTGTVFDTVQVQVNTWAKSALGAIELHAEARTAMERIGPLEWRLVSLVNLERSGRFRGLAGTYRFEVAY